MQFSTSPCSGQYNIYPGFRMEDGVLYAGYSALAEQIVQHRLIIIDGYGGVDWVSFRDYLNQILIARGIDAAWINVQSALQSEANIDQIVSPFLGGDDPIFGTRFTGSLADFFNHQKLTSLRPDPTADINILYGTGAALANWNGLLVYVDVPKYEIQLRTRTGKICNLGASLPYSPKQMYKRFYFVDWVALNKHKASLLPGIDLFLDCQNTEEPVMISGPNLRQAITRMSRNYFRVRPWFEPGPWGGQWMKAHIPQLSKDVPNYAWSFELIVPENGLLLESEGLLLEFSFDLLMFQEYQAVLGKSADVFHYEFPIRFDFLDTFDGGNLSLQCHPRSEYARTNFGETFTQDETYYILDCLTGARVYLGFCDDIDPPAFRSELEQSFARGIPVNVERYVNTVQAHKHDLFLIPNGTIHCSGMNNMVLEISATPYIFTFKMYDWLRLDLDGQPRPLNIGRAFDNLYFDRKGERIQQELVSHPQVIARGENWELSHLPTHPAHFYDVHRIKFTGVVDLPTNGSCQVMSLVEGKTVTLETAEGLRKCFNYAETFVVPAACQHFRLINEHSEPIMVVLAFIKESVSI